MRTKKKSLPLAEVYRLLEPGPVVLVSTHHKGIEDVMTMAWHTPLEFEPPLIGCVISELDYTFNLLKGSKQCVISIPTADLLKQVVGCGNTSGKKTDKFKKFGLTKVPASHVKAPMIEECFANLECKLVDTKLVPKYNFFILEVVRAWIDPQEKNPKTLHHRGKGTFMVAGRTVRSNSKMK